MNSSVKGSFYVKYGLLSVRLWRVQFVESTVYGEYGI